MFLLILGVIDSSGIRMHVTQSLRQHDVGMLIVGYQVGDSQVIPPQTPSFISSGYCDADLLARVSYTLNPFSAEF